MSGDFFRITVRLAATNGTSVIIMLFTTDTCEINVSDNQGASPKEPALAGDRNRPLFSNTLHNNQSTFSTAMTPKLNYSSPMTAALIMFATAVLFPTWPAVAQSPSSKPATTWQDLGFNQLPEGFSTDMIPLFEGLNKSRGSWSFKGEMTDGQTATPLQGNLLMQGNPQAGMFPMWKMDWGWPVDDPGQVISCVIMASPKSGLKAGFELGLIRIGPVNPSVKKNDRGIQRTMFKGTWDLKNRTIAWVESDLPDRLSGQSAEKDSAKPKQTFEMIVAADGKISIQNSKHMLKGQLVNGKTIIRTGEAPAVAATHTGKHSFKTVAEITDPRVKPWLPPQATEISLLSERGGHYARYKISEADFKKFLDQLWEAKKDSSAHQRDRMSGEGEPANRELMAKHFKAAGWEPLDNAITYYSPSKPSGAMTTYYYDREAGIAYHDRGYW